MLGRNWTIEGIVSKGKKRGRKIGFPTCNIDLGNYIVPKSGVYSSVGVLIIPIYVCHFGTYLSDSRPQNPAPGRFPCIDPE